MAEITRGVHPYRIGGYGKSAYGKGSQTLKDIETRPYHSKILKNKYRPFIYGRDLQRFKEPIAKDFIKYGPWLAEPRQPKFFEGDRVYSRKILGERLVVTVEKSNSIADQQVYITLSRNNKLKANYIAGILGSKLIAFFIRSFFNEANDAFPQIKVTQLKQLPICPIAFDDTKDKARHDHMVEMVKHMLAWNKQLAKAKTPQERALLERQIATTDKAIDQLVYELYGLTDKEIRLVEAG